MLKRRRQDEPPRTNDVEDAIYLRHSRQIIENKRCRIDQEKRKHKSTLLILARDHGHEITHTQGSIKRGELPTNTQTLIQIACTTNAWRIPPTNSKASLIPMHGDLQRHPRCLQKELLLKMLTRGFYNPKMLTNEGGGGSFYRDFEDQKRIRE